MPGTGGSQLPFGPGSKLWRYWVSGPGFAKWSKAAHKWTTLRRLLLEAGVPAHSVDGLTTNIIQATMPGYLKTNHKKKRETGMGIERRTAEVLEVRQTEDGGHEADIRIVTYDVIDSYKTRFRRGVFARAVEAGSIPAVWSHDSTRPIGVVTNLRDSAEALDGTLKFLPFEDVPDARMAYATMKNRAFTGISCGFERVADQRAEDDDEVRDITEANLIEASPVLRPAVPGARVLAVRNTQVVSAVIAADIVTRFAAGQLDLTDALIELRENGTTVAEPPAEEGAEQEAAADEKEHEAAEEEESAATETDEPAEDEGEDLPDELIGPETDEIFDEDGEVVPVTTAGDFDEYTFGHEGESSRSTDQTVLAILTRAEGGKPRTAAANGNYADPGYQKDKKKRYPLGNKDQVIAAWRYLGMPKNKKMYSSGQLAKIKAKVKAAAKKYGVNISENDRDS